MKKLLLLPFLFISVAIVSQAYFGQLGADIDGEAPNDNSGGSVSINANGDRLAIGAYFNDGNGASSGHVRIYDWNGTAWTQLGADIDGEATGDKSGYSVSINANGDRVAIGAYGNDGNGASSGHVRIYQWNGTTWTKLGADIDGEAASDLSGGSVSMNAAGDRLAIGAEYNNGSNAGHVRIYDWNGTAWIQLGQDIDGEAAYDYSGYPVSINANGGRVAIGAYRNDGNGIDAGHVRIYEWNGTAWTQLGADIDGEAPNDNSGCSVSINAAGDRLAIGARSNDGNAGHVRIYEWNGTAWTQLGADIDGEAAGDYSGTSVSINAAGDRLAIGAYGNDGNGPSSGHVRIYRWCLDTFSTESISAGGCYTWINGVTYYSSSDSAASYTLTNAAGCDSIVNLNLTITPLLVGIDSIVACDSYTWINNQTYTSAPLPGNIPSIYLTNSNGCDSLVTLHLTLNNIPTPDFTSNVSSFTSAPFLVDFSNSTPNLSDCNFTWDFSDGTILQSNNASVFHEYQYNGLYDVTLIAENILTGCTDTMLKTDNIYCTGGPSVSIIEVSNQINIYPNPTNENITISIENFNGNIHTEVYDLIGHRLQTTNETTISLRDYARGIYLLKVAYGDKVEEVKVIKD